MLDTKLRRAYILLATIERYAKASTLCIETQYLLQLMFLAGEPILLSQFSTRDLLEKKVTFPQDLVRYTKRARARLRLRLIPESWENDFLELIIIPIGGFVLLKPSSNEADRFLKDLLSFLNTSYSYIA